MTFPTSIFPGLAAGNQWGRGNPFASPTTMPSGLLGSVFAQPAGKSNYEQMAAPYAQWAAQQLQSVLPPEQRQAMQQPQQMPDAQQQALAGMYDQYRRMQEIERQGLLQGGR